LRQCANHSDASATKPHTPSAAPAAHSSSPSPNKRRTTTSALDIAKRLLDYNQHAPTIYSPMLVPECFLIEASETETKEAMDDFVDAMAKILEEANTHPETVTEAPFTQPVRRLDEVKAAKELDLVWSEC
tara:strand:- start:1467 stop:1856 length:390 start_codon:yes stop_codon:yes gene_type:complete